MAAPLHPAGIFAAPANLSEVAFEAQDLRSRHKAFSTLPWCRYRSDTGAILHMAGLHDPYVGGFWQVVAEVDHIVTSTHGNPAMRRYLTGVSSQVVAQANCSVTVVRFRAARPGVGAERTHTASSNTELCQVLEATRGFALGLLGWQP